LRTAQAKSYQDPISTKNVGHGAHACDPNYMGDVNEGSWPRLIRAKQCKTLSEK
jgi:hypothetical protein